MINYNNTNIQNGDKHWFYWWLTRLLLERITKFCAAQNCKNNTPHDKLRIIFSKRGGMKYDDFTNYLYRLRMQDTNNSIHLYQGSIVTEIIDINEVAVFGHKERAGLQLTDCVAGAFYKSVELNNNKCIPDYALALRNRMYSKGLKGQQKYIGHGIKPVPKFSDMNLHEAQKSVFRNYGAIIK